MQSPSRQRGVSLVELMVAMVLGLLVLGAVLQLFLASRQAYRTNEALARVQDSGRFALEFLDFDLRNAGYKGECIAPVNNLLDPDGEGYEARLFDAGQAVFGWNDGAGDYAADLNGYLAGTDVLLIKHAANASGVAASGNTPANANTINLDGPSGVAQGTIILVADPTGCDLFQNRSNAAASTLTRGSTGEPGNLNPGSHEFSHAYGPDMQILAFHSALYYVGAGSAGLPSLRRLRFDRGNTLVDEELVEGVLDLQVLYGVDTAGNRQAGAYLRADQVTDWDAVVAARVSLLVSSVEINVASDAQTVVFNGSDVLVPDRRLALVFSATTALRNRLP